MSELAHTLDPFQELVEIAPEVEPFLYEVEEESSTHSSSKRRRYDPKPLDWPLERFFPTSISYEEAKQSTSVLNAPALPQIPRAPMPVPQFKVRTKFIQLQKWEGIVLELSGETFIARLVDQTDQRPDEEAEIPLTDVSEDDLPLVEKGAIFYFSIGYLEDLSRGRQRVAEMRFRRLPAWTENEIELARIDADRTIKTLGWD